MGLVRSRFVVHPLWVSVSAVAVIALTPTIADTPHPTPAESTLSAQASLSGGRGVGQGMQSRYIPVPGSGPVQNLAPPPTAPPAPADQRFELRQDPEILYGTFDAPQLFAAQSALHGQRLTMPGGTRILSPGGFYSLHTVYAIQFDGRVTPPKRQQAQGLGATMLSYKPENVYIARLSPDDVPAVAALPAVRAVAPLIPADRISAPLAAHLATLASSDDLDVRVVFWRDVDPADTVQMLLDLGATVRAVVPHEFVPFVQVTAQPPLVSAMAQLEDVHRIEWAAPFTVSNAESVPVVQAGSYLGGKSIHAQGIRGSGQRIAVMDSGLDYDHAHFANATASRGTPGAAHRKVHNNADYAQGGGDTVACTSQDHGTHVAGTALGNATDISHPGAHDGVADLARVVFQDIQPSNGTNCFFGAVFPPANLTTSFSDARNTHSAFVHTNSWGNGGDNTYSTNSGHADTFMWNNLDFQVLFAAGNDGGGASTVDAPGTAKNVLTVGGHEADPNQFLIYGSSSRGPTGGAGARRKPTVMAPAIDSDADADYGASNPGITSASSDGNNNVHSSFETGFQGTSMATPAVAGSAALVRDYFMQGFYPTGTANGGDALTPSSALIRATLIASTERIFGVAARPSNDQGWGRVVLDNSLFFCGERRRLFVDDGSGVTDGASVVYTVNVTDASQELRVALAWTDYPNDALHNDVDLEVSDGTNTYLGSVFSAGFSVTGGAADSTNPDEAVFVQNPIVGTYTITVTGTNIQDNHPVEGNQPFALVVTGGFDTVNGSQLAGGPRIPTISGPVDHTRSGDTTPTVDLTSVDPEAQMITVDLEWDTDPAFGSPTQQTIGPFASAGMGSYTLNGGQALSNGLHYFRARARDAGGDQCESPWYTWHYAVQTGRAVDGFMQVVGSQFARDTLVNTMPGSVLLAPDFGTNESVSAAGALASTTLPNNAACSPSTSCAASNIMDGDFATAWASDGTNLPQWAEVDLGAITDLGAFIVDFGNFFAGNTPGDFEIQISDTGMGGSYTTVATLTDGQERAYLFTGRTQGRFIRMNATQNRFGAINAVVAMAELEIYSFVASGTATSTAANLTDFPQNPASWEQLRAVTDTANGTIAVQVQYDTGGGVFAPVPGGAMDILPGNEPTGFTAFPVDISALTAAGGFGTLRLQATLTNTAGTPRLLSWALEPLGAPTFASISGLAAAVQDEETGVEVSWRLESPLGVMDMRVTRAADAENGPWEPVGNIEPAPGALSGPYSLVDPAGAVNQAYRLEVDMADGSTDIYGPVFATAAAADDPRGCACGITPRTGPITSGSLLFILGTLFVLRRRRRSSS